MHVCREFNYENYAQKIISFGSKMAKKYQNKQDALRIQVYNFYNDHKSKGKMFTVNHFKLEKEPERTIYGIKQRAENNIMAKRKHGSGRIVTVHIMEMTIFTRVMFQQLLLV